MCEFNPIELAWAKVKRLIREQNITADMSLKKLEVATREAIHNVTKDDWMGYCQHVVKVEDSFFEKDGIIDDVVDRIVVSLDEDSDSTDIHEDSTSEEETDLAQPLPDSE